MATSKDSWVLIPSQQALILKQVFHPKTYSTSYLKPKFTFEYTFLILVESIKINFLFFFYIHGGGFFVSTPSSSKFHNYLNTLVAEAQVLAVSVHHRRAPEHPLPVAYEDSWAALKWVASHRKSDGPEAWLNSHADFGRVFVAGDSSGANIAHNTVMVAGNPELNLGVDLLGLAVVHPYFWGSDPIGSESLYPDKKASVDRLWPLVCPSNPDHDYPRVNRMVDGGKSLAGLGCKRVLVCVAEKDILKDRGWLYYQVLGRIEWKGVVEIYETEDEDHAFHLNNLHCKKAKILIKRLGAFFNKDVMPPPLH